MIRIIWIYIKSIASIMIHQWKRLWKINCRYCTKGCPKNIPIPEIFTAMNKQLGNGLMEQARTDYQIVTAGVGKASDCISCKQCEKACPQQLQIIDIIK